MNPVFDPGMQQALNIAAGFAQRFGHEFITLEHFIWSLGETNDGKAFFKEFNISVPQLKQELSNYLGKNLESFKKSELKRPPEPTLSLHRSIERAVRQAQSAEKNVVTVCHVMAASFEEEDSFAVYLLRKKGIEEFNIIEHITNSTDSAGQDEVSQYALLLNKKVLEEKNSYLTRSTILERVYHVLLRKTKNNPLLVGEPGVGKSALVETLTQQIEKKECPEDFFDYKVFQLDLSTLVAGTKYRGDFEKRFNKVIKEIKKHPRVILFIDEIHTVMGTGSTSGSQMDTSQLLKPLLTEDKIKFIGATTFSEYRKHIEKAPAFSRRFQMVEVTEPNKEETLTILNTIKPDLEEFHKVEYSEEVMAETYDLTQRYMFDRFQPDKSIDLLDETAAKHRLQKNTDIITKEHVEAVLSKILKLPEKSDPKDSELNSNLIFKDLDKKLKQFIYGQDEAIKTLTTALKSSFSGLKDERKPVGSFLFAGPTGVGKTEICRQLSDLLNLPLMRFDMSEYMEKHTVARLIGSPPGYVGHEDGGLLTDGIRKNPYSLLLLDEIEKAHPDVVNILLQVMDNGKLTDSQGRVSDFRHCLIVMTSNLGAKDAVKGTLGFVSQSKNQISDEAVKRHFSPEFINRLSKVIQFKELKDQQLSLIIEKFLNELKIKLEKKSIKFIWSDKVVQHILKKAFEPHMGGRPFQRYVEQNINPLFVDYILFDDETDQSFTLVLDNEELKLVKN